MSSNLVIVESPAKAKTIKKYLGDEFIVKSSYGHIRDLSKKNLGINIENDFTPDYEVPADKKKVVSELKKAVSQVDNVWLASDEDREGEAISWHLSEVLKLKKENTKRIVFHEITKSAIKNAIANPRDIDINIVNAQQARRVLDRLVGFSLSPLLWKKIKPSLSAGRVQSVAVRLIVEREREITNFKIKSYYKIIAYFEVEGNKIKAELNKKFKTHQEAKDFLNTCINEDFFVSDIVKKPGKKTPAPPFTTSTLQQEAGRKLGFSVSQTMKYAQSLYENGHITYMRTDSVTLSALSLNIIKENIINIFGEQYVKIRKYGNKIKGAQEAHEAIRPTFAGNEKAITNRQEIRLYELIRKRTLASQMQDAEIEKTTISISNKNEKINFNAVGEVVIFDGFLKLYKEATDEEIDNNDKQEEGQMSLPKLSKGQAATPINIEAIEKFETAPPRYTEASLVKKLEELGIGRPSTYAPTISTIQQREYVVKETKQAQTRNINIIRLEKNKIIEKIINEKYGAEINKLFPTSIGVIVNDYLVTHFSEVIDYNFTAQIEEKFDEIALGKLVWNKMIKNFYKPFIEQIDASLKEREVSKWEREVGKHPQTGQTILLKVGKYGAYASIEGGDKPIHASLKKNQNIENITLEEVLDLFKLPRNIGEYDNDIVTIAIGRFGPYIKNNNTFYSISKQDDPYTININRAIEIIEEKKQKKQNTLNRTFEELPGLQILKGRYGPYISYEKTNYRIPNTYDPETMSLEECKKIMEDKNKK